MYQILFVKRAIFTIFNTPPPLLSKIKLSIVSSIKLWSLEKVDNPFSTVLHFSRFWTGVIFTPPGLFELYSACFAISKVILGIKRCPLTYHYFFSSCTAVDGLDGGQSAFFQNREMEDQKAPAHKLIPF